LKGLQGQSLTIDAGPWRATLIDFWASWCTPCRLSFPWMNSLHERLSERGLRILAINLDRRREDAVRFLSAHPARFEIALDPTAQSASALNIQAMPTSMLLGRDSVIRWTHKGFRESDTEGLEQRIKEALR
jgi:thiol-disulfide isomerase/thioredoxin